jgi:SPOR domain
MDQDNSKGQDKRNWRERLGIGAQGAKDLPKISDDFRKEPTPAATRPVASARPVASSRPAPAVKPAPMAPRANPKPITAAPASPDKLAERLRSQREASTKLAEQRVQVAKQRAETQMVPPPAAKPQLAGGPKPKFTFAEDSNAAAQAPKVAAPVARPAAPQPQVPQPQMSPARPPLGGAGVGAPPPVFQPRPQQQQPFPPQPQYQPPPQVPLGYQPQYNQQPVPPYRPIDPNSGYAPPPGYVPQQRGFTPQPGQFIPPQNSPRLNMPPRGAPSLNPNYQPPQDFGAPQQPGFGAPPPRVARPPMRAPAALPQQDEGAYEEEYDDQASALGNRRPSTNDYQQAYREAEYGYEDEAPRSRAPWILAGLLLLALAVAGVGVWLYLSSVKPLMTGQPTTDQVPAVAAPETPAKVQAEPAAGEATTRGLDTPSKKKIYDRIVGDQEVLGGELAPATETPAAIPEPVNEAAPPAAEPNGSGGEESAPLPIPPPPGGANDQQGSLAPENSKQPAENISPAAGESQAAVAAPGDGEVAAPQPNDAPSAVEDVPVPGELKRLTSEPAAEENIRDATPAPVVKKKVVAKPKVEAEKKAATPSLGSKPIVLVPPAKKPTGTTKKQRLQNNAGDKPTAPGDSTGLYGVDGDADLNTANTDAAPAVPTTPVKKKKTLSDLFAGDDTAPTPAPAPAKIAAAPEAQPVVPAKPAVKKPQAAAPEQQASLGGFAVQLASFRSRNEATTEFGRLKAKHSAALGGFSPIISEAKVGGSTRYRLSVGGISSQAQANAVCSKLFAGGERDCLVKRQ